MIPEITITLPDTRGMPREEFDRLIADTYQRIGYDGTLGYLFLGSIENRTWHFAWYKGSLYRRSDDQRLLTRLALEPAPSGDPPDVICPCGSTSFGLYYGTYDLKARCSSCGAEQEVYSG